MKMPSKKREGQEPFFLGQVGNNRGLHDHPLTLPRNPTVIRNLQLTKCSKEWLVAVSMDTVRFHFQAVRDIAQLRSCVSTLNPDDRALRNRDGTRLTWTE